MDPTEMPYNGRTAKDRISEAEAVRNELNEALHVAGITLPSLRVDPLAYSDEHPRPLVELGRCNVLTARRLAAVLRKGQAHEQETL